MQRHESRPQFQPSRSGCTAFVSMVQPANFWQFYHSPEFGRLNSTRNWRVFVEYRPCGQIGQNEQLWVIHGVHEAAAPNPGSEITLHRQPSIAARIQQVSFRYCPERIRKIAQPCKHPFVESGDCLRGIKPDAVAQKRQRRAVISHRRFHDGTRSGMEDRYQVDPIGVPVPSVDALVRDTRRTVCSSSVPCRHPLGFGV